MKLIAAIAAVASVLPGSNGQGCDAIDCDPSAASANAYSICYNAVLNGVFDPRIVPAYMSESELLGWCDGACRANSRELYYTVNSSNHLPGAVWDICSGCEISIVQGFCEICNGGAEIAICSPPTVRGCDFVSGDPTGDDSEEEYMAATASADECRDLVLQHRGAATGIAWSTNDYDNDGLGSCYAEYGSTRFDNLGTSHYRSCIFIDSDTTTPSLMPMSTTVITTDAEDTGMGTTDAEQTTDPSNRIIPVLDILTGSGGSGDRIGGGRKGSYKKGGVDPCSKLGGKSKAMGKYSKKCGMSLSTSKSGFSTGASVSLATFVVIATALVVLAVHRRRKIVMIESDIAEDNEEQIKSLLMHETSPLLDGDCLSRSREDTSFSEIKAIMV